MKHTISVLVENKFGVLARISTLFAARGFNIDSLSVGETENSNISRMTIVVNGDNSVLEQVEKQLNKLIDVIKVSNFSETEYIQRDLALIKISVNKNSRTEVIQIINIFRAKIVDVSSDSIIAEITGDEEKIEAFLTLLKPFSIKEMCRTGIIAMARGLK
ncbi:MAG: acetolactate synthase small subunit [Endomicrobiia bacterium]|nr:acetolactate synthase small subunit [Endomicrobiaceae bacterium]MDD3053535.1 acetolactate synthase small subunit [Endomicrobiaceae bacterium]MDD3923269.1 acetolactate synthase small subunit [Endomicrobiaceae bacterium]MDD5102074.1 acetolactate synthase small subunit [Endomicrobiaceae bacterium]